MLCDWKILDIILLKITMLFCLDKMITHRTIDHNSMYNNFLISTYRYLSLYCQMTETMTSGLRLSPKMWHSTSTVWRAMYMLCRDRLKERHCCPCLLELREWRKQQKRKSMKQPFASFDCLNAGNSYTGLFSMPFGNFRMNKTLT